MLQIPGYHVYEQVSEHLHSRIYRARREKDQQPVICKVLKHDRPSIEELARYQREYDLIKTFASEKIINAHELLRHQHSFVMVLEDFGGESLQHILANRRPTLEESLTLAIRIVECVGVVHAERVIHKDLNPSNIIYNPHTGQVKLIDFGIATRLRQEIQGAANVRALEGTLAYIAPEQTGRMNRNIDYRSDFYALGATLYELLTGRLPFEARDPMELVHSHLARLPIAPHQFDPQIPEAVSAIIMKLLAKNAEDRYHSTAGIIHDLTRCLDQLRATGQIVPFELGTRDISPVFTLPQKLYGRTAEIRSLLAAFDRVAAGSAEMVQVSGHPGIGKSALIHEIHKPLTAKRGFFIEGKFDQFSRNIPYSALTHAFQELVAYLLTEPDAILADWKQKILTAVGSNGQVVTAILPELELVIGKQPDVQPLPPQETQNRFMLVFQNFIRVFCTPEHPLVIFIDDLQWADTPSITLLQRLLDNPENAYLLMIIAYRDTDVDAGHPLRQAIEELRRAGVTISAIDVPPLTFADILELTADALHSEQPVVEPLTRLVLEKTNGNPFFIGEFLKTLSAEELLRFDAEQGWTFDIQKIAAKAAAANVVELMVGKIRTLPAAAQEMLQLAAAIGSRFDLSMLSIVSGNPPTEVLQSLSAALEEGLILPLSEEFNYVQSAAALQEHFKEHSGAAETLNAPFKFVHDRVQEAAYSLIGEDRKQRLHYQIGRLLLEKLSETEREEYLFDIVGHLNKGRALLQDAGEQLELVKLNLRAGQRAKASTAYAPAAELFQTGAGLLPDDAWKTFYDLTCALYTELAEATYLARQFERAQEFFELVKREARAQKDKVRIYMMEIDFHFIQMRFADAIAVGLAALKELGEELPAQPDMAAVGQELQAMWAATGGRAFADFFDLPDMTDERYRCIMDILTNLYTSTYFVTPLLFAIVVIRTVTLSIRFGVTVSSSFAFGAFGIVLSTLREFNKGYESMQLALHLADRYGNAFWQGRAYFVFAIFTTFNRLRLRELSCYEKKSLSFALEGGDMMYGGLMIHLIAYYLLHSGELLPTVYTEVTEQYAGLLQRMKNMPASIMLNFHIQTMANLLGKSADPVMLKGEFCDEDTLVPILRQNSASTPLGFWVVHKMFLTYLFGKYADGLEIAWENEAFTPAVHQAAWTEIMFIFYYALLLADRMNDLSAEKQTIAREKLLAYQADFAERTQLCPANFANKHALVSAEIARITGDHEQAGKLYAQAVSLANEHEFLHEEALANECAARYYLSIQVEKVARVYLQDAYYCYQRWGALAKVRQLEELYPQWLGKAAAAPAHPVERETDSITTTMTTDSTASLLDVTTMIKASQALSQEVQLEQVLRRLMHLVIENAGAQQGVLLLKEGDDLLIQGQIQVDGTIEVMQGHVIASEAQQSQGHVIASEAKQSRRDEGIASSQTPRNDTVSTAIVDYVARTLESVVLADATRDPRFGRDAYVQRRQTKSLLCQPILHKGSVSGILYLENNLSPNAFTPERLELLKVLASQAAISLENAKLVEGLREQERLQKEMELAQQIQTALLPGKVEHPELDIEAVMLPAEEVGGDYYDILTGRDGHLWLAIGDVSGHGVTPGLIMMMAQTIHAALTTHFALSPKEVVEMLNLSLFRNVRDRLGEDHFMTFTTLQYLGQGRFRHAGAHLSLLVYRQATQTVEQIKTSGVWLSFIPDVSHATANLEFTLAVGDTLFLYTDGLTEAHRTEGELLDIQRFTEIIKTHAQPNPAVAALRDAIINDVLEWCGRERKDDMTLVVARRVK